MADIKLGASALDGFYIGSTEVTKLYVGDIEIFSSAPPFDSGLILNGTFDDSSNLTHDANWTIASGVASYNNSANAYLNLDLSGDLLTVAHTITFDISNSTSDAQIEWIFRNNGSLVQKQVVTYVGGDGAYSYNFTPVSTANEFSVRGRTGGGSFDLDNISLTAD